MKVIIVGFVIGFLSFVFTSIWKWKVKFKGLPRIQNFVECTHGNKYWYLNDQLHRTDGPAIESANGDKHWYLNGQRHRTDGPAIEYANGKHWYLNGQRHRTDGPAIEYANGDKSWYLNGQLHRRQHVCAEAVDHLFALYSPPTDGPAHECANGKRI